VRLSSGYRTDEVRMTDPSFIPPALPPCVTDHGQSWDELEPDEQAVIAAAFTALHAGQFEWLLAWQRFVDAAVDLMPTLVDGPRAVEVREAISVSSVRIPQGHVPDDVGGQPRRP
jgi:hypothetical protein